MPMENFDSLVAVNPPFAPSTSPSLGNLGRVPMGWSVQRYMAKLQPKISVPGVPALKAPLATVAARVPMPGLPVPGSLSEQIKKLPMLEQARILTEMKADPKMVPHVEKLLAQPDPLKAILDDRQKAVADIVKPGIIPGYGNKWGVFKKYMTPALNIVIERRAKAKQKRFGLFGAPPTDEYPNLYGMGWSRANEYPVADEGVGQWAELFATVAKEAMPLIKEYGVPAIKKNLDVVTKKKDTAPVVQQAAEAASKNLPAAEAQLDKLVVKQAQTQAAEASYEADPANQPKPKMSTGMKVGIGVGATVGAAALAFIAYKVFFRKR